MSAGRPASFVPLTLMILVVAIVAASLFVVFAESDDSDAAYESVEFTQDDYRVGLSIYTSTYVLTIYSYEGSDTEVVMPDYFTYKGEKYYVESFSVDIFGGSGGLKEPCKSITSLTLPSDVWTIDGDWSIFTKIETFNIGPGLTHMDVSSTLGSMDTLEEVNVDPSNTVFSSQDGVMFDKAVTSLLFYPMGKDDSSFTFPSSLLTIDECSRIRENVHLKSVDVEAGNPAMTTEGGVLYDSGKNTVLLYPRGMESESFVMPSTVTYLDRPIFSSYLESVTFSADFAEAAVEIGFRYGYMTIPDGAISASFASTEPFTVTFEKVDSPSKVLKDVSDNAYYRLDVEGSDTFAVPLTMKLYSVRYLATNMHVLCVDDDGNSAETTIKERSRSGVVFEASSPGNYTYVFKDTTTIENAPMIAAVIAGVGTVLALITIIRNARRND